MRRTVVAFSEFAAMEDDGSGITPPIGGLGDVGCDERAPLVDDLPPHADEADTDERCTGPELQEMR